MMNVVLIGYRGSGKTACGRMLADRLGWDFVDSDDHLQAQAQMTIKQIFEREGEVSFRDREGRTIAELARRDRTVISVGGGAVLRGENVDCLKSSGKVIWLTAPPEVLFERIRNDLTTAQSRPNLTSAGGLEEVKQLLQAREPLYAAAADEIVDTTLGESIGDVVDRIRQELKI
jgi:shikimate kinase